MEAPDNVRKERCSLNEFAAPDVRRHTGERRPRASRAPSLRAMTIGFVLVATLPGCSPLLSQCTSPEPLEAAGPPAEMAVVVEAHAARQNGEEVPGLIVQVLLLDAEGRSAIADGGLSFAVYRESVATQKQLSPDEQWTFTLDEVNQALSHSDLGTVYNFWLPRKGVLSTADRLSVLTTLSGGSTLSQWNRLSTKQTKMTVEQLSHPAPEQASPAMGKGQ